LVTGNPGGWQMGTIGAKKELELDKISYQGEL
jgi:hypothetical protein